MDTVGFRTRDGFLYTLPIKLVVKASTVLADMISAHQALYERGAVDATMIVIDVPYSAKVMKHASWCIIDKQLHLHYKKEGMPSKIMAEDATTDELLDGIEMANTFGL